LDLFLRVQLLTEDSVELLENLWWAGVHAVSGRLSVARSLARLTNYHADLIIAVGKAAGAMYRGAIDVLGGDPVAVVVTKPGHARDHLLGQSQVTLFESGHPIPNADSLRAGASIIRAMSNADVNSSVLLLVSGGASALAEMLPPDLRLRDWQEATADLIASGADIHSINKQRRSTSMLKGGQLLQRFRGRSARVLAISDVPGDSIAVIGSGLGDASLCRTEVSTEIVASNSLARTAIATTAQVLGVKLHIDEQTLDGELFSVAKRLGLVLRNGPPGLYLWGGEPTLRLPAQPGKGGRNQSLALAIARELQGASVDVLAAGTDGTDGPTVAAGAVLQAAMRYDSARLNAALRGADAGSFLAELESQHAGAKLFVTGPTDTNVMDIVICYKH
jgi:hydroxypyruvate reductase